MYSALRTASIVIRSRTSLAERELKKSSKESTVGSLSPRLPISICASSGAAAPASRLSTMLSSDFAIGHMDEFEDGGAPPSSPPRVSPLVAPAPSDAPELVFWPHLTRASCGSAPPSPLFVARGAGGEPSACNGGALPSGRTRVEAPPSPLSLRGGAGSAGVGFAGDASDSDEGGVWRTRAASGTGGVVAWHPRVVTSLLAAANDMHSRLDRLDF